MSERADDIEARALEALGEAVIVVRPDGSIRDWNAAASRLFGRRAADVLGLPVLDVLRILSPGRRDAVAAALEAGRVCSGEVLVEHPDGSVIGVQVTGSPLHDDEGRALGCVLMAAALDAVDRAGRPRRELQLVSRHAPDGTFRWVSPNVRELLGYEPDELRGRSVYELFHPDDLAALREVVEIARPGRASLSLLELRIRRRDGSYAWFETLVQDTAPPVDGDTASGSDEYVCVSRDVSARREVDEHAPVGIATMHPDGPILHVNPALAAFLGREASEVIGRTLEELGSRVSEARGAEDRAEMCFRRPDGDLAWGLVSRWLVSDDDGSPRHVVCHVVDITDRKLHEEEIAHRELYDPQTGLASRTLFADRVAHALSRMRRWPSSLAQLHVDIDDFKAVNDSFGYAAGDEVLAAVAERLARVLRAVDTLARATTLGRFGGDEFLVLCEGLADEASAVTIAERIQHAFSEPFVVGGDQEVVLAVSIGIATTSEPTYDAADLAREAYTAAHRAREQRGRGIEFFDAELRRRTQARLETEAALQRALERDELLLHYQPTVDLLTGRVVGVEALVRWQHPERGLLLPDDFVPVAERSGLVVTLGRWVLREACRQAAGWRAPLGEHFSVSVNLSARHLGREDLATDVAEALAAAGIPPSMLCVEITETAVMEDLEHAVPELRALAEVGVAFAMDDFGTGYSSLSQLVELPVDRVKIDQAFVRGLGHDPKHAALVSAMTEMAHALGLTVVAEGIETDRQLAEVRRLHCDVGQGFLFGRPLPASALLPFIARSRPGIASVAS